MSILFTVIETLNYVQFYTKCYTLRSPVRVSDTLGFISLTDTQSQSR